MALSAELPRLPVSNTLISKYFRFRISGEGVVWSHDGYVASSNQSFRIQSRVCNNFLL